MIAVFPGETDVLVMMFKNSTQPAFFCKRFTPALSLAQLTAVEKGATQEDLLKKDPGAAVNVYAPLGYTSKTLMCCTTDGRVVILGFSGGKLSEMTVY